MTEEEMVANELIEQLRDHRHFEATRAAVKESAHRGEYLPKAERYACAYGVLRMYFLSVVTNFAPAFTMEQMAGIIMVLDQLERLVGEDKHLRLVGKGERLSEETKRAGDQLALLLRGLGDMDF